MAHILDAHSAGRKGLSLKGKHANVCSFLTMVVEFTAIFRSVKVVASARQLVKMQLYRKYGNTEDDIHYLPENDNTEFKFAKPSEKRIGETERKIE